MQIFWTESLGISLGLLFHIRMNTAIQIDTKKIRPQIPNRNRDFRKTLSTATLNQFGLFRLFFFRCVALVVARPPISKSSNNRRRRRTICIVCFKASWERTLCVGLFPPFMTRISNSKEYKLLSHFHSKSLSIVAICDECVVSNEIHVHIKYSTGHRYKLWDDTPIEMKQRALSSSLEESDIFFRLCRPVALNCIQCETSGSERRW